MEKRARAVIIGGGCMGVGLLYHLALEGWTDSILVEKGELTSGSTWHAAGQCPSFVGDYNMAQIHHYGNTLYPKLEEMTGQYTSWHASGGIRFATTPEEVDWFKHVQSIADLIGFRMEIVSPEESRRINPLVSTDGVLACAVTYDDGHVDPSGVTNAMAKGAKDLGATIMTHNRVLGTTQLKNGEWKVETENGTIYCEHLVNAAGSYADMVGSWVGVDVPMTNMKHRYVVTEPIQAFIDADKEMPVMRDPYCAAYYRQEQESLLIGIYETRNSLIAWDGSNPKWESSNELFETDLEPVIPWLERIMERMEIFEDAGIKRVVNGAISHTSDGNPLLGPVAGLKNYWMCAGASIGIAQGAGSGKYLAQWMVHGASEINMVGMEPRRYGMYADQDYLRTTSCQDYEHMYALHVPGEERPAGRNKRLTPLFEKLKAKGAVYTQAYGWERPKWFSPDGREENLSFRRNNVFDVVGEEVKAIQERVGIIDLSSFAKFKVTGADSLAFLNRVTANRVGRKDGAVALTHALNDDGRIESEFTITRFSETDFYVLSGAAAEMRDMDILTQSLEEGEDVNVSNITDDYGILVVTGPRSRELLAKITDADLSNEAFPWLTGQEIEVAGVGLRALRVSYVGELGWELHTPMAELEKVYDAVWAAGEEFGIADFGSYAVNNMRMEKGYAGWGTELTTEITMVEAGMRRFVSYKKGDFVGRDALLKKKEEGIDIKLVYMEMDVDDCDPHGNEAIFDGDKAIGIVTSGGYGYRCGKSLAFGYIDADNTSETLDVQILGKKYAAKIITEPAYDPKNERLKAVS